MAEGDIEYAIRLTDLERWGYTIQDFRRFMRMDPRGTLVAWDGPNRVGVATATSYGKVAWIGSIIVEPDHRGKGCGKTLVEKALQYCHDEGAETCWLNSYEEVEPFYRRLGFKPAGATLHMTGQAEGALHPGVRLVHSGEVEVVAAFDTPYFGTSRLKVLKELYHDHGNSFLRSSTEDVVAYVVGAPYSGGVEVAPWVCHPSKPHRARELLMHLLAQHPGITFELNVPEENEEALRILKPFGFEVAFRTTRMYYGPGTHGINPQGVFSLGGLEKG